MLSYCDLQSPAESTKQGGSSDGGSENSDGENVDNDEENVGKGILSGLSEQEMHKFPGEEKEKAEYANGFGNGKLKAIANKFVSLSF